MNLYIDEMSDKVLAEIVNSETMRAKPLFDFDSHTFKETEYIDKVYIDDQHYEDTWMSIVGLCCKELINRGFKPFSSIELEGKEVLLPNGRYKINNNKCPGWYVVYLTPIDNGSPYTIASYYVWPQFFII